MRYPIEDMGVILVSKSGEDKIDLWPNVHEDANSVSGMTK
uniref:Uncharacterized protein n=1 Tax=Arundo donax TaxID=35708 RepID=A0A0A8ZS13_ARUDO